jgi:glycosyltransferase involved in cell wall biosynthesis
VSAERLRILLITGWFPPLKCGVGDYTARLAAALADRGDVDVAVLTDARVQSVNRANVEIIAAIKGWTLSDLYRIARIVATWRPDVVHMQFGSNGYRRRVLPWVLPWLLTRGRIHVVQTWHEYSGDPLRVIRNLPNAFAPGGLVTVKPNYQQMMHGWYRRLIAHKEFRYIPNASTIPSVALAEKDRQSLRMEMCGEGKRLVAYFGFANARKGVDRVFDIANPETDCLVLICDLAESDEYQRRVLNRLSTPPWLGKARSTGFLPPERVGQLLAAADAVVLPFPDGGGVWSTSAQAAMAQGTFVLATARDRSGYDPVENVYYADPANLDEMREALGMYAGGARSRSGIGADLGWNSIARQHVELYRLVRQKQAETTSPRS